jgi:tetratricopeptide (TPR) repeat protein
VLVEREHPLARLTALLDEAAAGSGRLVLLGGEAGIGKTSLVAALAEAAAGRLAVRRGGSDSVGPTAALGPFVDAVPELSDVIEQAADVDRAHLFRRLRTVLGAEPTLLVLEDVHWADEATLEMLRFLGRRLADLPLLVVATYRDDELVPEAALTSVLGDLATAPGVGRLLLEPLTVDGVRQLAQAAGSPVDPDELRAGTDGNPFYVTEVLAAGGAGVPATVRDAVLARTARLSPPARRVLAAAAVLGQRAGLGLLASVAGEPAAAVDECLRSGVLVPAGDGWAFRHELARRVVEQTLSPVTRADLHARAFTALSGTGAGDDRRLTRHAAGSGDGAAVLVHGPLAAARAARLGAHREAAELYRLALRFAEDAATRVRLVEALAYECYLTGRLEEAREARLTALELAERAGDVRAVGTDQRWLSRLSWYLGRNDDAERYGAAAVATLERVDDGHELAMAYSNMSQLGMLAGDAATTVAWGERALALARRIGDADVEIHALNNTGTVLDAQADSPEGAEMLRHSLELAIRHDAHEHAARAYTNLGNIGVRNRRFAEGDRYLRAGVAYCEQRDLEPWELYMSAWLARSSAEQGRLGAAEEYVARVLDRPNLAPIARMVALPVAGLLALRRDGVEPGHLREAWEMAERTGEEQRVWPAAAALAEAAWLTGRTDEIVAEVDRAWDVVVARRGPWAVGELTWWLSVAGVRRETPVPVARPFALMLDGAWREAAQAWEEIGSPLWAALALGCSPDVADGRRAVEIADGLGAAAVRRALLRDRHAHGLPVPREPRAETRRNPSQLTGR